jgi:hypothetical protein
MSLIAGECWLEIQFKVPLLGDLLVYKDPSKNPWVQPQRRRDSPNGGTSLSPVQKKTNRDKVLMKGKNEFSLPRWSKSDNTPSP